MADYTYTIQAGAANVAPNFDTINGAVADFIANNRMAVGVNKVADGFTLYFKVHGFLNFGNVNQAVIGILFDTGATGQIVLCADTNPFNASTANRLGYSESYDGFKFGGSDSYNSGHVGQRNLTIRDLIVSGSIASGYGILGLMGATSSQRVRIQRCIVYNTATSSAFASAAYMRHVDAENCIFAGMDDGGAGSVRVVNIDGDGASSSANLRHCTVVGLVSATGGVGLYANNAPYPFCFNCYVGGGGWTTPYGNAPAQTSVGNASSATDTPENNTALESVAFSTTNFVNVTPNTTTPASGTEDLKVKATSVLKTTGAARLTGVVDTDIFGQSRSATATVGCFEVVSAAAGPAYAALERRAGRGSFRGQL